MGPRNLLLCLLALLALAPSSAAASGWPGFGGGAGRSGHDALDPGAGTPVAGVWERNSGPLPGETVRGGPVVAWGAPGGTRVAYGIESGSVFVQRFGDGSFIGSPSGVPVGSDADIFGTANGAVSPVTVSGALDPGQIYVLHNDDGPNDLALAQIDASTGALVQDAAAVGHRRLHRRELSADHRARRQRDGAPSLRRRRRGGSEAALPSRHRQCAFHLRLVGHPWLHHRSQRQSRGLAGARVASGPDRCADRIRRAWNLGGLHVPRDILGGRPAAGSGRPRDVRHRPDPRGAAHAATACFPELRRAASRHRPISTWPGTAHPTRW